MPGAEKVGQRPIRNEQTRGLKSLVQEAGPPFPILKTHWSEFDEELNFLF